jgi:hypothetical protein
LAGTGFHNEGEPMSPTQEARTSSAIAACDPTGGACAVPPECRQP